MLTQLVQQAQKKPDHLQPVSTIVGLGIDWLTGHENAQDAIRKMDNAEKQSFALELIEAISVMNSPYQEDNEKRDLAKKELIALFGEAVLNDPATKVGRRSFFFSLTHNGRTFRAWYDSFGTVSQEHFDSCGKGCLFSASCECVKTMKEWLQPFVDRKVEWRNPLYGTVWMGWQGR